MPIMTDNDQLSKMQLDILELELQGETKPGEKISKFRALHPSVTEMGYYSALLVLIGQPVAYEIDGQRYGAMLRRLDATQKENMRQRLGLRARPTDVSAV